jgi:ribosome-binding factor A
MLYRSKIQPILEFTMPSKIRVERVAVRIKEVLSELLIMEIRDPRVQGTFITDVTVDREFSYAEIYVSALEGVERKEEILSGLNSARDFIRRYLANHISLRSFPNIRFHWDATPEKADHIEKLLASIRSEEIIEETDDESETLTSNDEHE